MKLNKIDKKKIKQIYVNLQQCHEIFGFRFLIKQLQPITPDGGVFILKIFIQYIKLPRNVCVCDRPKLVNWLQIYNYCTDPVFLKVIYMKSHAGFPFTGDGKMKYPEHIQYSLDTCPLNHQETKTRGNL